MRKIRALFPSKTLVNKTRIFISAIFDIMNIKRWNTIWYDSSIFYFVLRHCDIRTAINPPRLDYTRNLCSERNASMIRIDLMSVLRPQIVRSKYSDDFSPQTQSRCCRPDTAMILRDFCETHFYTFHVIPVDHFMKTRLRARAHFILILIIQKRIIN